MTKIFSHATQATTTAPGGGVGAGTPAGGTAPGASAPAASGQTGASAGAMPAKTVDINSVLDGLAAKNSEKLDWRHSIVDLLKLVGMDSSLAARKELAQDLHYTGDMNDSATMNMWLSKEVQKKLGENDGKMPADLMHQAK